SSMRSTAPRSTCFPYTTLFRSEINEATVQRLNESERAVSAWKVRASEMQRAHQRSELQRLRAELRYRKTAGQLRRLRARRWWRRSEEHTSELQSRENLVCRLLL